MKKIFIVLIAFSFLSSFSQNENFTFSQLDYVNTPIYKQIKKHPENYRYLDSVELFRIQYLSEDLKITGLMAAPKIDGKFPVIIYNRGGNRNYGQLLVSSATDILSPIAARGYVVVASNYRGNGGSDGKEEFGGSDVTDVVNLAKNVGTFHKADTSRIGLLGISRGGMMNYLVLKHAHDFGLNIKCAIAIGGIVDLEKTIEHHSEIGTVCEEIIPNYSANKIAEQQKRSAIFWTQELPKNIPLLILHSYDDAAVAYEQIPPFIDSLEKYNVNYKHIAYKKDNHGIVKHQLHVKEQINYWLDNYLKSSNTATVINTNEIVD